MACVEREQDDSKSEDVDLDALVWLTFMKLRCHVTDCAHQSVVPACAIIAGDSPCEAHIDQLDVIIAIEQDIGTLEITMGESFLVHVEHA